MRKLASVRKIKDVVPIEGADAIELVKIDDWQCVSKKGEFVPGQLCVYFEIDSFLPVREEFEFLRKSSFKKMGDEPGFRIKTIRLRGQLSQGLALPVPIFFDQFVGSKYDEGQDLREFFLPGVDLTALLGVQKYEPPIPAELGGMVKGNYPGFIPKTDQERCQNIGDNIFGVQKESTYEETIKLDGTSFTGYRRGDETGVCSRNWELQINESNAGNSFVRMFVDSGLRDALTKFSRNYAVQGELMGPGIQQNREALRSIKLFIFDIFDIDAQQYVLPEDRHALMKELYANGVDPAMVDHVPILAVGVTLADLGITNVSDLLNRAEGPSLVHAVREGNVYKKMDGTFSFKAISNIFLLKEKD